jgi:hypothetical protein
MFASLFWFGFIALIFIGALIVEGFLLIDAIKANTKQKAEQFEETKAILDRYNLTAKRQRKPKQKTIPFDGK